MHGLNPKTGSKPPERDGQGERARAKSALWHGIVHRGLCRTGKPSTRNEVLIPSPLRNKSCSRQTAERRPRDGGKI